jgi:peptidyl-prolyl cis-trans isomerase B (cyclophilin B)
MKRIALLLPIAILLVGCGGSDSDSDGDSAGGGNQAVDCEISGDKSKADLAELEDGKTYTVAIKTNKGDFSFELATDISPCTTASFAGLVENGFYDGLTFHRIVPGFVIQGGDPAGDGTGGAGYSVVDTPPADTTYDKGLVAMAKTASDPPGTAGSQFFVVSSDGVQLPPEYGVLGRVVDGIDTVEKIEKLGNPSDPTGAPSERVVMEKVSVTSS